MAFGAVEVFQRQQAERSQRIVDEAGPRHEHKRLRAEGRSALIRELLQLLSEREDDGPTTG